MLKKMKTQHRIQRKKEETERINEK